MSKRKASVIVDAATLKSRRLTAAGAENNATDTNHQGLPSNIFTPSLSGDIGLIESISLKNFMCHHSLGPVQFGPHVNFIVGNNGSGKSAILTGLIVGLGGKATMTNRGLSLKDFVKSGENTADVTVKLRNRGADAYKKDLYGDYIIIEQRISSDGSRTYKLKNKSGQLVSNKKEELIAVLDHFNIQLDNPVSILSQEMSKQFLHSKNESDKYKFFMKATLLEQMKRDYIHINLKDLKQEFLQKKERYESLSSFSDLTETLENLKKNMAWCLVTAYLICFFKLWYFLFFIFLACCLQFLHSFPHPKIKKEQDKLRYKKTLCGFAYESKMKRKNQLLASRSNKLKRFGDNVPDLIAAIDEAFAAGRFIKKPVGPIGACISMKDPSLAVAVECCLRSFMKAFCCDNYKDESVLQGLMSRFYPKGNRPQIIVSSFSDKLYNVHGRKACHPDYQTVLDTITATTPVILNSLVDMRGIETILIIKVNKARKIMQRGRPPKNCREAFTAEGDQVFPNRYYTSEFSMAKYLSGDIETEIHVISEPYILPQEEVAQENQQKVELEKQAVQEAKAELDKQRKSSEEADSKYSSVRDKIDQLVEEIEPLKVNKNVNAFPYNFCFAVQDEQLKLETECVKHERNLKLLEKQLKTHRDNIQAMKGMLLEREEELQENIEKAKQISPERQEVTCSTKSIDAEITRLKKKLKVYESNHGEQEQVIREYAEALSLYKEKTNQVRDLRKFIDRLNIIMSDRQNRYKIMRRSLSVRCKLYFNNFLIKMNCCGSMIFDHNNETLSISVRPPGRDKDGASDMRSLSGGERSFSTVCFMLSLWEITESPFRCLDEFDVYMDMHNRRICLDLLLELSERQHLRQFIFITPLNTSNLPRTALIKIHHLGDPEREDRHTKDKDVQQV
uniref:Structural maintenance of chromosomes protein 6 n=1 Tax=Cyprinodon variegatus TaxID=28743 RepID=A0A3Q2DB56_CYPVA